MWQAWKLSQTYRTRPSEIYGVHDELAALFFDKAVHLFGTSVENDVAASVAGARSQTQANGRRQAVMSRWLGIRQQFRDPGVAKKTTV